MEDAARAGVTRRLRELGVKEAIWQRNYHERIIRNERELLAIRQYIVDNPAKWALDKENPSASD